MSETETRDSVPEAPARGGGVTKLVVLLGTSAMPMIDATIVNVAAPSIAHDLPASPTQLQFIVGGYLLAYGALIITGARWGARYGHARVLGLAVLGFVLASVACGLAPGPTVLIAARFVQGMTAAPILPQVMSLMQKSYTGPALARALAMFSLSTAGGFVVGQLGGGLLVAANPFGLGWRLIFLVNVPLGLLLWLGLRRSFEADRGVPGVRVDLGGVVAAAVTLVLIIAPLTFGREYHWAPWTLVLLALAVPAAVVFAAVERGVARRGGSPLVSAQVLRTPGLVNAVAVVVLVFANYAGFLFCTTMFLQSEHHYGPLGSGLWILFFTPGFVAVTVLWKRVPPHRLGALVAAGALVTAAGDLLLWRAAHVPTVGVEFAVALLVLGTGTGAVFGPILTLALRSVAPERTAEASGIVTTMFQVGSALGVSTVGSIYFGAQHGFAEAALCLAAIAVVAAVSAGRLHVVASR